MSALAVILVSMTIIFLSASQETILYRSFYMHIMCAHRLYRKHIKVYFAFASELHSQIFLPWPSVFAQPKLVDTWLLNVLPVLAVGLGCHFLSSSWIL